MYLLLDEVQNVDSWEKAINSFKIDFDIYITGSNAYLLSSELSTLLSGRYIETKMYPLSFKEYLIFNNYSKEIVYLELLRRGYRVNIGKSNDYEVDFVAENPNEIKYYQVARTLVNDDVKTRELRSLENIEDNYEKIILTMDKSINNDYNGIKIINIIDFLLEDDK